MKKTLLLIPALLALLLAGCLKDDFEQGTIVLLGTEWEVQPIDSVIPNILLDTINSDTIISPLPEGIKPPNIQGEYVFKPIKLYKCNDDNYHLEPDKAIYLRFGYQPHYEVDTVTLKVGDTLVQGAFAIPLKEGDTLVHGTDTVVLMDSITSMQIIDTVFHYVGQNNMLVPCAIYGDVMEKNNEYKLKTIENAIVMGDGEGPFTAYFTIKYECEYEDTGLKYDLTRGYVIKGKVTPKAIVRKGGIVEITPGGIEEAVLACINKEVSDAIQSMKDKYYIYCVDKDNTFGTAVRQHWVKP